MLYRYLLLLFLLGFVFLSGAHANELEEKRDSVTMRYTVDEIVIESFKQNRGLYLQPVSASMLLGREIKEHNISSIKEFSAFIPNLFMPDYGSKMTSPVYIRGIGSRINSPSVALYVDGVPYFDRSSFDININDVEQIEVLRGPQGTIYGRNTMGGVINIFTKSPFKSQGTYVNLSAGSHNTYETGVSHYGKINKDLGYSLSTTYNHGGGYFKNTLTNKKADPIDAISTRARLSWRIKPRLSAHLTLAYEYSDQDGYPYRMYNKEDGTMADVNYNAPSFYKRNLSTNGLHLTYVTNDFVLNSQSSFQFFDGNQGLDQDFSPEDKYYVDFYQRQQMYSQEVNIKSLSEESIYKWQFGVFGFHQNYYQNNNTDYRQLEKPKHVLQHAKNPTSGYAIYHQSTLENLLVRNLSFIFGIRYDWEKTRSTLNRSSFLYDSPVVELPEEKGKASFSQITPKFSLNYSFYTNGLVYISATRGYKTGGFNNTADTEEDRVFDPEYSWSYELGTKSSLFKNLLHLDLSLFFIDWRDQQISQKKLAGQGFILRNAGKSESKGLEFTANLHPLKNFEFQLAYGYTEAKYKRYRDSDDAENQSKNYDGNYLPMVPRNTFSTSASYILPIEQKFLDNIRFNIQYVGIGKIYWDDENNISQSYYNTLNGKVSFKKNNLSVDCWAKNITSENYIAYYFNALGSDFVQKGKPLTFGIDINYKF